MARAFSSIGDYLKTTAITLTGYPFSCFCWMYPTFTTGVYGILSFCDDTADDLKRCFLFHEAGLLKEYIDNQQGKTVGTITANAWYAVGWSANSGTSSDRSLWLNGSKTVCDVTLTWTNNTQNHLAIGQFSDFSGSSAFSGLIAHAAWWNRSLSDAEQTALAAGFSPLFFRNGLRGYWPLYPSEAGGNASSPVSAPMLDQGNTGGGEPPAKVFFPQTIRIGTPRIHTVKQSGGDFATLNAALISTAVGPGDTISIEGAWTADDTTATVVADDNLLIRCVGESRHPGYWDETQNHYRLVGTDDTYLFTALTKNIVIDGLCFELNMTVTPKNAYCVYLFPGTGKTATLRNCLVRSTSTMLYTALVWTGYNGVSGTINLENCILYGAPTSGILSENANNGGTPGALNLNVNSCTIWKCGTGSSGSTRGGICYSDNSSQASTINVHNTINMQHTAGSCFLYNSTYDATWNIDYSISSDASITARDAGAVGSLQSYTLTDVDAAGNVVIVIDDSTTAAADLRLLDSANNDAQDMHTAATSAGLTIPSLDIVGRNRPINTNYDCGAYEVPLAQVSGATSMIIMVF